MGQEEFGHDVTNQSEVRFQKIYEIKEKIHKGSHQLIFF